MKIIYLDIDGVLNSHSKQANGYCSIEPEPVRHLNHILAKTGAYIVVSSAWRYYVLNHDMTLSGFAGMLECFGVQTFHSEDRCSRIIGVTCSDEDIWGKGRDFDWMKEQGVRCRSRQIGLHVEAYRPDSYVVLDDMEPLREWFTPARLVLTDGVIGLTANDAERAIAILNA